MLNLMKKLQPYWIHFIPLLIVPGYFLIVTGLIIHKWNKSKEASKENADAYHSNSVMC
jgi:hypothetical protein